MGAGSGQSFTFLHFIFDLYDGKMRRGIQRQFSHHKHACKTHTLTLYGRLGYVVSVIGIFRKAERKRIYCGGFGQHVFKLKRFILSLYWISLWSTCFVSSNHAYIYIFVLIIWLLWVDHLIPNLYYPTVECCGQLKTVLVKGTIVRQFAGCIS